MLSDGRSALVNIRQLKQFHQSANHVNWPTNTTRFYSDRSRSAGSPCPGPARSIPRRFSASVMKCAATAPPLVPPPVTFTMTSGICLGPNRADGTHFIPETWVTWPQWVVETLDPRIYAAINRWTAIRKDPAPCRPSDQSESWGQCLALLPLIP